jgi:hypothetical protein
MIFFSVVLTPNAGHVLLILEVSRSHTTTHHSRLDFSGRVISPSQRPLPDNTHNKHPCPTGGIRTHDISRREAADLRLRPRGHWERLCMTIQFYNFTVHILTILFMYDRNICKCTTTRDYVRLQQISS